MCGRFRKRTCLRQHPVYANVNAGNGVANFVQHFQKRAGVRAALHARENAAAGMLQRNIQILRQTRMRGNRLQQSRRDAVRVAVEKANPAQILDLRQAFEQQRQPISNAQVFAVVGRVLPDQRNFARRLPPDFPLRAPPIRTGGCGISRAAAESRRTCRDDRSPR